MESGGGGRGDEWGGVECKERGGRQVAVMEVRSRCPILTSSNVDEGRSGDGEGRGGEGRGSCRWCCIGFPVGCCGMYPVKSTCDCEGVECIL
jgi:hypothetical protein